METFLLVLKYIAGPLLGAVIGYFTNWLAVRMLFRPYYPKRIGKLKLPFTPGIIPKRKPALAKALGKAVGEELFTKEDMTNALVTDAAKDKIADYAVNLWRSSGEMTAQELFAKFLTEEQTEQVKAAAEKIIGGKVYSAVQKANLGKIVADESVKVINQKKSSLGMLAMFLSNDLIYSLTNKLADGVNAYVEEKGEEIIYNAVQNELNGALSSNLSGVTSAVDDSVVRNAASCLFEKAVKAVVAQLAESVDIPAVVEQKINAMDVKELEKLVLSVMKKELAAIVNLGALIGLILGIIMVFV